MINTNTEARYKYYISFNFNNHINKQSGFGRITFHTKYSSINTIEQINEIEEQISKENNNIDLVIINIIPLPIYGKEV